MTEQDGPAIAVRGVGVSYGGRPILNQVTLSVPEGGVYGLLGRNGSGKTTLVRCVLGIESPPEGLVEVFGEGVWNHRARLMERVGVVPERPQAPPGMTASQLMRVVASIRPGWHSGDFEARLRRFGVPDSVPFGRLSKGQQKQVELALALGHRPRLLVLDDPSLGLDSVAKRLLYDELLSQLADEGTTVFVTSHDLDAIERVAETVAVLHGGSIVVEEPLDHLKARFRRVTVSHENGVPPDLEVISSRQGPWGRQVVLAAAGPEAPWPVGAEPLALEEIFVALAGETEGGGT